MRKLIDSGIKGKIWNVIVNMYNEIKSCVWLEGIWSEYFV